MGWPQRNTENSKKMKRVHIRPRFVVIWRLSDQCDGFLPQSSLCEFLRLKPGIFTAKERQGTRRRHRLRIAPRRRDAEKSTVPLGRVIVGIVGTRRYFIPFAILEIFCGHFIRGFQVHQVSLFGLTSLPPDRSGVGTWQTRDRLPGHGLLWPSGSFSYTYCYH